MVTRSWRNLLS